MKGTVKEGDRGASAERGEETEGTEIDEPEGGK